MFTYHPGNRSCIICRNIAIYRHMSKTIDWEGAGECLRLISHPHRLQAIQRLLEREHSVGELAEICGVQSNVMSEHLTLMKHKQLIAARREGRKTFYSLNEPALGSIMSCIEKRFSEGK